MSQINNTYGSGGMSMALNDNQFAAFIQHLKNVHHGELPLQKAAMTIGRQPCGMTWAFGHIHVGANGQVIDEKESNYVWIDQSIIGDSYHHVLNDDSYHPTSTHLSALHLLNTCCL